MPTEWENTKQVFLIVNIIIQWINKTVELLSTMQNTKDLHFLKLVLN